MRISDWSSDVCSSDLGIGGLGSGEHALGDRDLRLRRRDRRAHSVLDDLTLVLAAVGKGSLEARWAAAQRPAAEYLDVPETIAVGVHFAVGGRARIVQHWFLLGRVSTRSAACGARV